MTNNTVCYDEEGNVTDNIFCGFPSENQCCGSGWDCLSNGLCQESGTTAFSQGTCTDVNYDLCLRFCDKSEFGGGTAVSSCGINSWCCAGASGLDCCDDGDTTTLQPFPYSTILAAQVGKSTTVSTTSSSSKTSSVSTATTTSSGVSTTLSSFSATTTSSNALATATSPATNSSSNGISTGATIGLGIGVAFGVLLLAALAFFIYRHRKRKQKRGPTALHHSHIEGAESLSQDLSTGEMTHQSFVAEPAGAGMYEMHGLLGGNGRQELPGNNLGHELPG